MTPQELKNSILQMAIQGRLVEQRPEEGTAEELYLQIQEEKQRLIKDGKIKKEKPLPEVSEDEKLFEIPESWKWVRLCAVGYTQTGNTPSKSHPEYIGNDIPFITPGDIFNSHIFYDHQALSKLGKAVAHICSPNSILQVCIGGSIGKAAVSDKEVAFNQQINSISPFLCDSQYIYFVMTSQYFITAMKGAAGGTATPIINRGLWDNLSLPLPPLAEQKRIVAKIEELLPCIDRYEQAWNRLEDFNKHFPDDMKKSILQKATQGKLVEQRPVEGTAEELYRQIQEERERLIKAGKIKKEKPLPEIAEEEMPFEIPESWRWVRLANLCKSISDGDHQPPPQVPTGIPFLVISNVSSGKFDFSNTRYVPQSYFDALSHDRIADDGDILFTVTGSYGIPIKVDCGQRFCFQRHIALLKLLIDWDYLFYALKSPIVQSQCDSIATGTAQKTVGLKSLRNMVIPLPPLAEQRRIVARLEELLPLCERLK